MQEGELFVFQLNRQFHQLLNTNTPCEYSNVICYEIDSSWGWGPAWEKNPSTWQNQVYYNYFDKDGGVKFIYVARVATSIFDVVFLMYPSKSRKAHFPASSPSCFQFSATKSQKSKWFRGKCESRGWISHLDQNVASTSDSFKPARYSFNFTFRPTKNTGERAAVIFIWLTLARSYVSYWCASSVSWTLECGSRSGCRWSPRRPRAWPRCASSCRRACRCCTHSCTRSGTARPPNAGAALKRPNWFKDGIG